MNSRELQIILHGRPTVLHHVDFTGKTNCLHHVDFTGMCTLYRTLECVSESETASHGNHSYRFACYLSESASIIQQPAILGHMICICNK